MKTIPVSEPLLGEEEAKAVLECIRGGWISSESPHVRNFESAMADYCSMSEGVAVSNGTAALVVAMKALDLPIGSEIIMPSFTIISCALAAIEAGAIPVLVDSDPDTWTMDVTQVEERITSRTKAIMAVHMYGHPVDMDPLVKLSCRHGLSIIEDTAEALGSEYKGKKCGGISHLSAHSFYANKLITTGEGGMILSSNPELADRARYHRNLCFRSDRRFFHTDLGFNFRMTGIQAAIGLAQLNRLDQFVARKREMANQYSLALAGLPLKLPVEKAWAKNNYWMYSVVLNETVKKDASYFINELAVLGIQTRPFFLGMHEQPALHAKGLFRGETYPVCEEISKKGFYLPSGQAITDEQIDKVCRAMHKLLGTSVK